MTDFTTVFEITRWSNGLLADELLRLAIGVFALLGVAGSWVFAWRRHGVLPWRKAGSSLFIALWAIAWLVLHDFPSMYRRIDGLATAYRQGRCEVSEGVVNVKFEQPAHGHTSGDRIEVDGRSFVVDHFYATPAYSDTIAHAGVLRQGAYVRLCHVDGAIVRVDLGKPRASPPVAADPSAAAGSR